MRNEMLPRWCFDSWQYCNGDCKNCKRSALWAGRGCEGVGSGAEDQVNEVQEKQTGTLCWRCRRAAGPIHMRCSWSKDFAPVPGWLARKTQIRDYTRGGYIDSYHVISCPLFKREKYRKENSYDWFPDWGSEDHA